MFRPGSGTLFAQPSPTATVRLEVVELWERLYLDEDGKDIELLAKDGSVWAHGVILSQLSEPLKCTLRAGMRETTTKQIEMRDYTVSELKFTLRLAYTGHIDESDYRSNDTAAALESGTSASSADSAIPPLWNPFNTVAAGPPPPGPPPPGTGLFGGVPPGAMIAPRTPPQHPWRVAQHAPGATAVPAQQPQQHPPLDILFGCASISKRFEMPGLVSLMLDKLKALVTAQNFNSVMRSAVALDLSPLKLHCVRFAESSSDIQRQYQAGSLSPEVEFELRALWDTPTSKLAARGAKRKAFF